MVGWYILSVVDKDSQSQSPDKLYQLTTSIYQPGIRVGHRDVTEMNDTNCSITHEDVKQIKKGSLNLTVLERELGKQL
jgi:hypothetical protein